MSNKKLEGKYCLCWGVPCGCWWVCQPNLVFSVLKLNNKTFMGLFLSPGSHFIKILENRPPKILPVLLTFSRGHPFWMSTGHEYQLPSADSSLLSWLDMKLIQTGLFFGTHFVSQFYIGLYWSSSYNIFLWEIFNKFGKQTVLALA